jgi:hypothetical protein
MSIISMIYHNKEYQVNIRRTIYHQAMYITLTFHSINLILTYNIFRNYFPYIYTKNLVIILLLFIIFAFYAMKQY